MPFALSAQASLSFALYGYIVWVVSPPALQGEASSQPAADIGPFMQACFSGAVSERSSCIAQVDSKASPQVSKSMPCKWPSHIAM